MSDEFIDLLISWQWDQIFLNHQKIISHIAIAGFVVAIILICSIIKSKIEKGA